MVVRTAADMVTTLEAIAHAALSPSRVRVSMNMGMNAEERAPSPKRRRNRLGMVKATKNADAMRDVPKK